jgi:hypothetical protein
MAAINNKRNFSTVIWIMIIILLGALMLWGFYTEYEAEREFQQHKEKEQNHSF